jgi:hypothetical protein
VTAPATLIAGLALVAGAAVLTIVAMSAVLADDQIVWGSIALATFCTGLLLLMPAATGDDGLGLASWRVGPWSLIWGALAFGLATITWIGPRIGTEAAILPASILRALWMIALAMAVFTVGYCAVPGRLAVARARQAADAVTGPLTDDIRGPAVPWVLLGIGVTAQLGYALLTGHLGYIGDAAASVSTASGYSQYLAIAGDCVPLSVAAAAVRAYQTRAAGAWLSLVVLFSAAICTGAVIGSKTSFVVAILAVIIPRTVIRRRLPVAAVAVALLFFLLIVIPFNISYRASARGTVTLSTGRAIAASPAIAGQVLASDLSPSVLLRSAGYLAERIRTIDSPAIILQRTPAQIPYRSPADLVISPVVNLVPRILWPGKPILAEGYQVSQEYYHFPSQLYTSSAVTPEGDLYRHGGWFTVIAGAFLGGCGIRIFDEVTDLRRSVRGAFLIVLLFPDFVQAGSDCSTLLAGIPGYILLWLAACALSFRRGTMASVTGKASIPGPRLPARSRRRSGPG